MEDALPSNREVVEILQGQSNVSGKTGARSRSMTTMPSYKSHKVVQALKIKLIELKDDGGMVFWPVEEGYDPVPLDPAYVVKHAPVSGGYYVVYADGYESWSPAKAFEEGYKRI